MEEHLIDSSHGTTVLIAGLVIILCLHLVVKIIETIRNDSRQKNKDIEEQLKHLTEAVQQYNNRLSDVEREVATLPKTKVDIRRIFNIFRYQAGDNWAKYRQMMDDDLD